jgi:NAD(P)-dependent dehydrogenase (short-subunit alcohol dehydrogenase family)
VTDPHVLIVGSGSVGKRHARNLASLGCRISCVDPREERRKELAAETPVIGSYPTIEDALSIGGLDGVVVGSPTAFHPAQTISALEAGLPVLLEKPVAKTAAEAHAMRGRNGEPACLSCLVIRGAGGRRLRVSALYSATARWVRCAMYSFTCPRIWRTGTPGNRIKNSLWPAPRRVAARCWTRATGLI